MARRDKVSANQFIATAVAEKAAAMAALQQAVLFGASGTLDRTHPVDPSVAPSAVVADGGLVRRRLLALAQYLRELKSVVEGGRDRYRSDWRVQRAAERTLQLSIDVCADLATYVVADQHLGAPGATTSAFDLLHDANLIDANLAVALTRMTRLRNQLVRDYVTLDPVRVFEIAADSAADLQRFADVMRKVIR